MKKILLVSIAVFFSSNVHAAGGTIDGTSLTWDVTDGVLTVSGTGSIPTFSQSEVSYHNYVTTAPWQSYASQVNSIVLEDGVRDIGQYAFNGIKATSVTFGNTVGVIGQYAFAGTNIQNVVLPDSVSNVAEGAFGSNSNLQSLTIPETTTFERYMFDNPSSLTVYCKGNTATCDSHLSAYGISTQTAPQTQEPSQGHTNGGSSGNSNHQKHRIYTVEEASAVSHDEGNTVMIRYK